MVQVFNKMRKVFQIAPIVAEILFFKQQPLDCARGDKKGLERKAGIAFPENETTICFKKKCQTELVWHLLSLFFSLVSN